MTAEYSCVFGRFLENQEGLNVHKESKSLTHWLNGKLLQRLLVQKDSRTDIDFLKYDKFKKDLWVRLVIYPSFPITDLNSFYLGRRNGTGKWHGVYYVKNSPYPSYYSETGNTPKMSLLDGEEPINWGNMGRARQPDYVGAYTTSYTEENTTESFYARLVPSRFAPIAQISYTENFDPETTLTVDTSFPMGVKDFHQIVLKAKGVLTSRNPSEDSVRDFSYKLHDIFEPFFPMEKD